MERAHGKDTRPKSAHARPLPAATSAACAPRWTASYPPSCHPILTATHSSTACRTCSRSPSFHSLPFFFVFVRCTAKKQAASRSYKKHEHAHEQPSFAAGMAAVQANRLHAGHTPTRLRLLFGIVSLDSQSMECVLNPSQQPCHLINSQRK